ncbi:MAG: I78 family peptidase inhibitor [Burkholderiaceae bacterium]
MKRLLLLFVIALAGCQTGAKQTSVAMTDDDPCGANAFKRLVGTAGDKVADDMFPVGTRVLRPGMVMTMDYRRDRLNVVIGESGVVDRVHCG